MLTQVLVLAALGLAVEKAVETQFGLAGVIGLLLLRIGVSRRNAVCASIGATVLVMLVLNP
ncbi:hypothetical protein [Streptomyces aidingensis]|uniref:Uncharacterized protein n=1 Tax=Streptomyces aidingensis TaxID=910347 RepID=A0A1I1HRH9_9ACTN|nr:hypothetical protein [Streptomyces aidingensis]SFC26461.1 hypothetical protein SAMN05421773_102492 [Streptomyces aidingensis]